MTNMYWFFHINYIRNGQSHLVHQNDPGLHITCDISGCQLTFTRVFSYKSHLRPTHRDKKFKKPVAQLTHCIEEVNQVNEEIVDTQNVDEMNKMKRANALYLLKLKEKNFLT